MLLSWLPADTSAGWRFVALMAFLAASFAISVVLTRLFIARFGARGIIAPVSARGMHDAPVPVGGGWAIVPLVLLALALFPSPQYGAAENIVAAGFAFLAALSWVDDRRHLSGLVRLAAQAAVVATVLVLMPTHLTVFSHHWPLWADRLLTALCWLWFINLFNFMDGIDGLAGMEVLFITTGLLFIGMQLDHAVAELVPFVVLAGATAGFLWHNWPPAKIFLGDVGAIPLGFLLGWWLIRLAAEGHLAAAFLLPGYFLADATFTLLRRLLAGEAFWKPHRSHFYQRAALALNGHAPVLWRILPTNILLLMLAFASLRWPLAASAAGLLVVAGTLLALHQTAKSPRPH